MADEFVKSNNEKTIKLFYDRLIYEAVASADRPEWYDQSGVTNVLNFRDAEKMLYGRVDRYYIPIFLNPADTPMTDLQASNDKQSRLKVASYVADAFKDLAYQFQKSAMMNKISTNEPYLTNLLPQRAYEDPQNLYYIYFNKIIGVMQSYYIDNNIVFENFDQFMVHLMESLRATAPKYPITFPAYMKSRLCPSTTTGIVIDLVDNISCADDQAKIDSFINSKNWQYYINACRSYGFSVDVNNPWRLIADIGSSEMVKYARKYGFYSTEDIISTGFTPAYRPFFAGFKNFLLNLYNMLKMDSYMESSYCQDGSTIPQVKIPTSYSLQDIENKYSESFFVDIYCRIRFLEEENKFDSNQQKNLIKDCMELYRLKGIDRALMQFEKIINQTYKYQGSLTSTVNRAKFTLE
jgi:hypothetical protein